MTPSPSYFPLPVSSALLPVLVPLHALFRPRVRLPLSTWAEANFYLSSEYSARTGNIRLYGWQRGIFDSFTDPAVEETVLMTGVQMVKSIFIQAAIAYTVVENPGPILLLEPKEDAAIAFSKRRLTAMVRDCPCLHGLISDSLHDGKSTLLSKEFPGGNLLIVSANTPTDVAQHTVRVVLCDEPDKYVDSVGRGGKNEGDPMDLAWERAGTFWNRQRVMACSPTVEGLSRIGRAYDASDGRLPYVPCWKCGYLQVLRWKNDGGDFLVKWDTSFSKSAQPATAYYECIRCNAHWNDLQRWKACGGPGLPWDGEWRAQRPFTGAAGFWISHLYSPWKKLSQIAKHFLSVKNDRTRLQVFVNTVLAEQWTDEGAALDHEILYARRESYAFGDQDGAVVPQRGLFLTAAVDVQDNPPRLEVEIVAWGRNRECWSTDYKVIQCRAQIPALQPDGRVLYTDGSLLPVTHRSLWDRLDTEVLQKSYLHESGKTMPIMAIAIDTGKTPAPVYEFARRHTQLAHNPAKGIRVYAARTVVPIKGTPDPLRIVSSVSNENQARKRHGVRIIGIGTHCAKQEIHDALRNVSRIEDGTLSGAPAPGCYHHPLYDLDYFKGVASEERIVHAAGKSGSSVEWRKKHGVERNEPFDLKVYNRGMYSVCGADRFTDGQWRVMEAAVSAGAPNVDTPPVISTPAAEPNPEPVSAAPVAAPAIVPTAASVYTKPLLRRPIRGSFQLP